MKRHRVKKLLLLAFLLIIAISTYTVYFTQNGIVTVHERNDTTALVYHDIERNNDERPTLTTHEATPTSYESIKTTGAVVGDVIVSERSQTNDVENVPRNNTFEISRDTQERNLQEIKRLCLEEFKIQPISLETKERYKDLPLLLRERLQTTFVNDDYKLLVTVVYKTGSEGWKRIFKQLFERGQNVSQKALGSKDGIFTLSDVNKKFGAKAVADRLKNYFSVIFVRQPYSRILSAYRSKFLRMPNQFYVKKVRDIIRKVRLVSLPKDQTPDLQFDELVKFVGNGGWDEHWCPIFKDKKPCHIYYNFVGHLETVATDVEYLFKLIGIDTLVDFPDCGHATGSADLAVLKDYFSNISQPMLQKLNSRYRDDFKIFGYHLPNNNSDLDLTVGYKL